MAIRTVDIFAIGRALGYTDAQTRSFSAFEVDGSRHQVTVERFVAHPDTGGRMVPDESKGEDGYPLLMSDVFYYTPVGHPDPFTPAENVRLSKPVIEALKRMQW